VNPGLRYLLAKGPTALMRRFKRRLRGGRGVATLIGTLFLIALLVGPQVMRYVTLRDVEQIGAMAADARLFGPPAILLLVLLTSASGGFLFKPAEIQFLFPAPVGRRELLIYNALSKLRVQVLSGLWLSIFTLPYAPLWYGAVMATCLTLAFWQLAAQNIGLLLATIEQRLGSRARKAIMLAVAGLLLAGIAVAFVRVPEGTGPLATIEAVASWSPLRWLSWPLRPLVEIYVAETPMDLALWAGVSIALLALLIGAMTLFDVAYAESAIARAQKVQRALERVRSGGSPFAARGVKRGRLHVPRLPYWGGAGPVAWRQLQELTRNYRGVLVMGVMVFLFIGMFELMPRFATPEGAPRPAMPAPIMLGVIAFMLPMMTMQGAFDFRRDLSRMAVLKSLPVPDFALALGQIIPTTLLICFWELIAVVVISMTANAVDWRVLAAILPGLVPLNATLVAVDNILFLLMPYRIVVRDPGQVPFVPRLMLVTFLKMLLLFLIAGLAAIPGVIVWTVSLSAIPTGIAVAAFLTLVCVGTVWGVAAAFRAFDVSRDIPD
jgi:hypothetical protein